MTLRFPLLTLCSLAVTALAGCEVAPTTAYVPYDVTEVTDTVQDVPVDVAPEQADVGLSTDVVNPVGGAQLKAEVRIAKDFPNQVVSSLRSYLTSGSKLVRGNLYLQLCQDASCQTLVWSDKVKTDALLVSGSTIPLLVGGLPAGSYFARVALDSKYSQDYGDAADQTGFFGPFDTLQAAGTDPKPAEGKNPLTGTTAVTLADAAPADMGEVVLGHLLLPTPAFPAATETGRVVLATSGEGGYRNHIKSVDLSTLAVGAGVAPLVDGKPFAGDLCGFVRGQGSSLHVMGAGGKGAWVFTYDLATNKFATSSVYIPHPDCADGSCLSPGPESLPWPCRGAAVIQNAKTRLYLIDFKGAGALTTTGAYPLMVVELDATGAGKVLESYDKSKSDFLSTKRIFRGAAVVGDGLYLMEPSWSGQLGDEAKTAGKTAETTVYRVPIGADGKVDFAKREAYLAGIASEKCGSTNAWPPGFEAVTIGAETALLVGSDDAIQVLSPTGAKLTEIDTRDYGRLPGAFAVSPDGKLAYAMPHCKSISKKAKVLKGIGTTRTDLDRHAVAVLDLAGTLPKLTQTTADYDVDQVADGGIDMEFLYLKRDLLRWCETCTGQVPPTAYTGPAITVGTKSLFLRGTGTASIGKNSAGLGQVSDMGVFDLASGLGVAFRKWSIWMDGPSARWGFDLNPANPTRTYDDDQSVGAMLWVNQ
ncbi:MAG: hypothetical protein ACOYOB_09575 [Myxococcota bacterium]